MALTMGLVASMLIDFGDPDEAEKCIAAKVTPNELAMLQKYGLEDGDGEISKAEFILLCAVRLGALSTELIGVINERFKVLDIKKRGSIKYHELLDNRLTESKIRSGDEKVTPQIFSTNVSVSNDSVTVHAISQHDHDEHEIEQGVEMALEDL